MLQLARIASVKYTHIADPHKHGMTLCGRHAVEVFSGDPELVSCQNCLLQKERKMAPPKFVKTVKPGGVSYMPKELKPLPGQMNLF